MTTKRVVIVGIPGVGKTTVVTEVYSILQQKNITIENLTFGTIMFQEAEKIGISDRDGMRKLSVSDQQNLQIQAAKNIANINSDVVLIDTHLFIKTISGYMPGLPRPILKSLLPTNLVLVEASPEDVLSRRENDPTRNRDSATIESIELDNQIARSMLSSAGVLTSASLFIVTNADGKSKDAAQSIVQSLELD
jgi:adenylate kinase|tara:strand:- start:11987 stop:12565 length:579 start_codon:yes stop_codon:yes gene_type:complete